MEDYIFSWEPERRRSGTLNAKNWKMVQRSTAKSENLENDFTETVEKVQELGWKDGKRFVQLLERKRRGRKFVMKVASPPLKPDVTV